MSETEKLRNGAVWYAKHGWLVLPCHGIVNGGRCTCNSPHAEPKDVGKHPSISEWNTRATSDPVIVERWWETMPDGNVGVYAQGSGMLVIDIDPRSGGDRSFEDFLALVEGNLPPTVEAYTGSYVYNNKTSRGRHLFYKCDPSESLLGNLKSLGLPGVDIKHNGYVLVAPSRHFSGVTYEWVAGKAPWETEVAEAPEELLQVLRKKGARRGSTSLGQGDWDWLGGLDYDGERVDVEKMLQDGIDEGSRAVDIYKLACSIANKFPVDTSAGRLAVETMMIRFNAEKVRPPLELEGVGGLLSHVRRAIDFVIDNPKAKLAANRLSPGLMDWAAERQAESRGEIVVMKPTQDPVTNTVEWRAPDRSETLAGTLGGAVSESVHNGNSISQTFSNNNVDVPKDPDAVSEAEGGTPGRRTLSDTGNGRRLVDAFGSAIRYTPGLGWFTWDGNYWKPDAENLETRELAKRLATVIASEVANYEDPKAQSEVVAWATQAKSNPRLKGAIESATSDPRVVVPVEKWDNNDYLLGVMNGVIDLKTGKLLKGQPDLYITRRAPVAYNPGIRSPRWDQFINFATGGDKELQEWLQRAAGYTLTGLRTHDVMFLVYGPPGSSKNTFVEALVKAMGTQQYAWPLDSSILAQGDGHSSSTDLYHWAELRGKRMVWVDELPESERLKENSVKKLTGSSEISARSPGEKPFTFQSHAKLWVTTNHRPIINDDAMWRRIRPIPWSRVPEVSDPDLKAYLFDPEGGLPGILSWAVEGAIKLLGSSERDNLGWCTAVAEAADVYRKNEDRIGMFLDEETKAVEGVTTPIKAIYVAYRLWSDQRGERPLTQIAFQRKLSDRGCDIVGQGGRAELRGRQPMLRSVPDGAVDWGTALIRSEA